MRIGPRRGDERSGEEKREQPLPKVIRLPPDIAKENPQRPLQKEQRRDAKAEPRGKGDETGQGAVEGSQQAHARTWLAETRGGGKGGHRRDLRP